MHSFIEILIFLALGIGVQRWMRLPAVTPLKLNQFVINVTLPAVVLLNIPQLAIDRELLFPMFAGWLAVAMCAAAVMIASRLLGWRREVTGCLLLVAVLGNTSYLGFPMVVTLFGNSGLGYAIIYDQLGNFVPLAVYGTIVVALFSPRDEKISVPLVLRRILSFPPFVALLIALFVPLDYPRWLESLLSYVSLTMVPLTMFIIGLQFRLRVDPHDRVPLLLGLTIKMVLAPLVVLLFGWQLGYRGEILGVTVFEAAMPTMVTAGAMAIAANMAPRLSIAMIGIGLISGFVLLPLYAQGLQWLLAF
ncbi:Uncharacterised protein [BD1-7 clade bacterium]|uniref:AEC family transporter n=1 Tax=BD1-7 clade bacterium TaxID=2029982 RepID=A0A5S9PNM4_9GAMM|nr:Uncharacterised protein [BD1-7 clade bacterium]CAA0106077.1 Uncharacterised protein [BD1-7 clade bacterium]